MTRRLSPMLLALVQPIEGVLLPFGYRRVEATDWGHVFVAAHWESESVLVGATFEPREDWGYTWVAPRLPSDCWGLWRWPETGEMVPHRAGQPRWSHLPVADVLRKWGLDPVVDPSQPTVCGAPDSLRSWAGACATDLRRISAVLTGKDVDTLYDLIEHLPRSGSPGDDYPVPAFIRPAAQSVK